MLDDRQKKEIEQLVELSLKNAKRHWDNGGYELDVGQESIVLDSNKFESLERAGLPGHDIIIDGVTKIEKYIALVADMRDSSKHLMSAISTKKSSVSGLERVFYETSALLPALEKTISWEGGVVTEYLGDGVLAFFRVDDESDNGCDDAIRSAYRAAKNIVCDTRNIINGKLFDRYSLPELNIGVGLSISKTIIFLIGLESKKHPKAFGECVFRATKLSCGANKIYVDENIFKLWPSSAEGCLQFTKSKKDFKIFKGYLVEE